MILKFTTMYVMFRKVYNVGNSTDSFAAKQTLLATEYETPAKPGSVCTHLFFWLPFFVSPCIHRIISKTDLHLTSEGLSFWSCVQSAQFSIRSLITEVRIWSNKICSSRGLVFRMYLYLEVCRTCKGLFLYSFSLHTNFTYFKVTFLKVIRQ